MTDTPFVVSLVLPVYNGGTVFAECAASVRAAMADLNEDERRCVQIIVAENHSTDQTGVQAAELARDLGATVVRPPSHLGRTANWRFGLSKATGEWLLMLHADDLMGPHGLAHVLAAARRARPTDVIITGRHEHQRPNGSVVVRPRFARRTRLNGTQLARRLLPFHCPFVPFTVIRRSTYEQLGGFDERLELTQDWDLWLRAAQRGDVLTTDGLLGTWREHPMSKEYAARMAEEQLAVGGAISTGRSVLGTPHQLAELKARVLVDEGAARPSDAQILRLWAVRNSLVLNLLRLLPPRSRGTSG